MTSHKAIIIFISSLFILCLVPNLAYAKIHGVGADPIFDILGHDKPAEWSSWTRTQKHSYLMDLGVYPTQGDTYSGEVKSLELYFERLDLAQPEDWMEMTFEERRSYVSKEQDVGNYEKDTSVNDQVSSRVPAIEMIKERLILEIGSIYGLVALIFALTIGIASFLSLKSTLRKYVRYGIYYLLPAVLLFSSLAYPERSFFAFIGIISEYMLIFILFVKPISIIFSSRPFLRATTYRRESGIAVFWFFIFHAAGFIYYRGLLSFSDYLVPYMFWGTVAGLGMAILAITSNDYSIRLMKKNWKRLQYLVYAVFLMALAHISLFQYGSLIKLYIVGGVFVSLKMAQLMDLKA